MFYRERSSESYDCSLVKVTERLCQETERWKFCPLMKTLTNEEPVARSRFIDCPSCKTHTLKLKRVVQVGRCKSCHESYKIVIVYVKEGKKTRTSQKIEQAKDSTSQTSTLPSWQMPSDSSLFGSVPSDSASMFSDTGSIFDHQEESHETPSGSSQ